MKAVAQTCTGGSDCDAEVHHTQWPQEAASETRKNYGGVKRREHAD